MMFSSKTQNSTESIVEVSTIKYIDLFAQNDGFRNNFGWIHLKFPVGIDYVLQILFPSYITHSYISSKLKLVGKYIETLIQRAKLAIYCNIEDHGRPNQFALLGLETSFIFFSKNNY